MVPLCIGASLNPINSSIIATALSPIAEGLHIAVGRTAVLIAALYVASAICQPTMGELATRFGPRRVFLFGLCAILAGAVVGASASDLDALVAARILIGIGTSAGYPTAILLIQSQAARTGSAPGRMLGALSIAAQVTVAVGLPMGGVLVGLAGWRSTFLVNVPLVLVTAAATLLWVRPDDARLGSSLPTVIRSLDPLGMTLFAATMSGGVLFLMSLRHPRWSTLMATTVIVVALLLWELRHQSPFVDVRSLVRNRALTSTYVRNCATMLVMYCVLFGVSQWLQDGEGLSAVQAGLVVLPMTAFAALVSAPVARRNLIRVPLVIAAVAAVVSSIALRWMTMDTPIELVVVATTVLGITVGLSAIGNQAAVYAQATGSEMGIAAGLLRTSTNIGAILSSTVVSLAFGTTVTDAGLHAIATMLIGVSAAVLVTTVVDRGLPPALVRP
jgi:MFS family permease